MAVLIGEDGDLQLVAVINCANCAIGCLFALQMDVAAPDVHFTVSQFQQKDLAVVLCIVSVEVAE